MDSIQCVQKLFDTSNHSLQGHTIAISHCLGVFFSKNPANSIQFWDCPSDNRWPLHHRFDSQTKSLRLPIKYPNKESWDYCRKSECDDLILTWQMFFENSQYKGNNFLDTYDNDDHVILPMYTKGGGWLNTIDTSDSTYARATRLITNHASIGKYRARFLPNEANSCACNNNQLETRHHVLRECPLYRRYNYVEYVLSKIVDFLQINPRAFCFLDSIE